MYRGRFGVIAALRRMAAAAKAPAPPAQAPVEGQGEKATDLKGAYIAHVEHVQELMTEDEAMATAVGGGFELIGGIEAGLVRHYGLKPDGYVVDVGCGSGRLAKPLSAYLKGRYLGTDLAPQLLRYARSIVGRPDWRFEEVDHIGIPEADEQADMVVFFSVLTHLLHEQGYWYLEEARRVLKPGGTIIFSFLEFKQPEHWGTFEHTLAMSKTRTFTHLNVFIDRDWAPIWAERLEMELVDVRSAVDVVVPEGNLGQAICVLRKPLDDCSAQEKRAGP